MRIISETIREKGILILALLILMSGCVRSDNEDAEEYRNGSCIAFYPPGNETIANYAKQLCEEGKELIYDYVVEKAGDYYRISYLDGNIFYVDEEYRDLKVSVTDGAEMLSDMLRYEMKSRNYDQAYTSAFWVDTDKENLDLSKIGLQIRNEELILDFEDFSYQMILPIRYLKKISGIDLGIPGTDTYIKQNYINKDRPMVALTYDDGPYRKVDAVLYETLHRYGARATFYSVGSRMSKNELDSIREGIALGNEFGSHTEYHASLAKQSVEEARWAVMETVDYVYEKLGYKMKTYRPPYGSRNRELENVIGMPAVLWTVDSKDWSNRDEDITHDRIMSSVEDGDIVLMHSLYMSSAEASKKLIPELIDLGYQLVTVSELLEYKGYDIDHLKVVGSN